MARALVARYLVAGFAFMVSAAWFGLSLQSGFECLLVFVLALQAVRFYQRRRGSRTGTVRQRRGRDRAYLHDPASTEPRNVPPSATAGHDRTRRSGRVYDGLETDFDWPVANKASW